MLTNTSYCLLLRSIIINFCDLCGNEHVVGEKERARIILEGVLLNEVELYSGLSGVSVESSSVQYSSLSISLKILNVNCC